MLKTYVEIATNGDLSLLVVSGSADSETLQNAWEKIVSENAKYTNDRSYDIYQGLVYDYALIIAQQTVVSVCLEMLTHKIDLEIVEEVRSRGYNIDLTPVAYERTLKAAKQKCKNLITKAESKRKEIERQFGGRGEENKDVSFDEVIGFLELILDRTIMDAETMTLAKYNVLKKGAEAKQKAKNGSNRSERARI